MTGCESRGKVYPNVNVVDFLAKPKTREEFKEILKDNYILSIVMFVVMWQRFDHFCECLQILSRDL